MADPSITDAEFRRFQRLIYEIAGISLADSKQVLLVGRLGKRLRALQLKSFGQYHDLVAHGNDPLERQTMVDLRKGTRGAVPNCTVGLTCDREKYLQIVKDCVAAYK